MNFRASVPDKQDKNENKNKNQNQNQILDQSRVFVICHRAMLSKVCLIFGLLCIKACDSIVNNNNFKRSEHPVIESTINFLHQQSIGSLNKAEIINTTELLAINGDRQLLNKPSNGFPVIANSSNDKLIENQMVDIILIVPLHNKINYNDNKSNSDCSPILNANSLFILQAAIWVVDKINLDSSFAGGTKFNLIVVDSCSSSVILAAKLTKLLQKQKQTNNLLLGLVLIANDVSDARLVEKITSGTNITIISTLDYASHAHRVGSKNVSNSAPDQQVPSATVLQQKQKQNNININETKQQQFLFQTSISADNFVSATLAQAWNFNWTLATIIYEKGDEKSEHILKLFKLHKSRYKICLLEFELSSNSNAPLNGLWQLGTATGSRLLVPLVSHDRLRKFLSQLQQDSAQSSSKRDILNGFIWLTPAIGGYNDVDLDSFRQFESLLDERLIVARPKQGDIEQISDHFFSLKLASDGAKLNSFFGEFIAKLRPIAEQTGDANCIFVAQRLAEFSAPNFSSDMADKLESLWPLALQKCLAFIALSPQSQSKSEQQLVDFRSSSSRINKLKAIDAMQAVVAMVFGFARLKADHCNSSLTQQANEGGQWCNLSRQLEAKRANFRSLLNDYIQKTASLMPDMPDEAFRFEADNSDNGSHDYTGEDARIQDRGKVQVSNSRQIELLLLAESPQLTARVAFNGDKKFYGFYKLASFTSQAGNFEVDDNGDDNDNDNSEYDDQGNHASSNPLRPPQGSLALSQVLVDTEGSQSDQFVGKSSGQLIAVAPFVATSLVPILEPQQSGVEIAPFERVNLATFFEFKSSCISRELCNSCSSFVQPKSMINNSELLNTGASKASTLQIIQATSNNNQLTKLFIVGIFDLHHPKRGQPLACGPMDIDSGEFNSHRPMQNLESFLWAIDWVNGDKALLPGIKLVPIVIDSCSSILHMSQQLANLLFPNNNHHNNGDNAGQQQSQISREILAIVADSANSEFVEATVSLANSVGITTFVTQSKSTKLKQFAQQFVTSNKLNEPSDEAISSTAVNNQLLSLDGYDQLLFGKMTPSLPSLTAFKANIDNESDESEAYDLEEAIFNSQLISASSRNGLFGDQLQGPALVRMVAGNEQIAQAIVNLLQQMNWTFISIVYDPNDADLVDLHDELIKLILARNIQLSLDEHLNFASSHASNSQVLLEKLVQDLVTKSNFGSRVVISLLSNGNVRKLLNHLRSIRLNSSKFDSKFLTQLNSLVWLTVSDREPYYSFAIDSLGTIAISRSVSVNQEFKQAYDSTPMVKLTIRNRLMREYLQEILLNQKRHNQNQFNSIIDSCFIDKNKSINENSDRCKSISIQSLVDIATTTKSTENDEEQLTTNKLGFNKYLAGGWEHNGADVANAVLAIAKGLELVRLDLCGNDQSSGKHMQSEPCDRFQLYLKQQLEQRGSNYNELLSLSQLILINLKSASFKMFDGRQFELRDVHAVQAPSLLPTVSLFSQLRDKLKLYNLRFLQKNSIGFVKFGTYDELDGLLLNQTKTKVYSSPRFGAELPIDSVISSCLNDSACFIFDDKSSSFSGSLSESDPISHETKASDIASYINSLFKFDPQSSTNSPLESVKMANFDGLSEDFIQPNARLMRTTGGKTSDSIKFNLIVLLPLHIGEDYCLNQRHHLVNYSNDTKINKNSFESMAAIASALKLLNRKESPNDFGQPARAQTHQISIKQKKLSIELTVTVIDTCNSKKVALKELSKQLELSESGFNLKDMDDNKGKLLALIDFDDSLSKSVDAISSAHNLMHLTIAQHFQHTSEQLDQTDGGIASSEANDSKPKLNQNHLSLNLLPSKADEIRAIIKVINKLNPAKGQSVNLIYTDNHKYRDEFVRQANEAGICVAKLIWVPQLKDKQLFKRHTRKRLNSFLFGQNKGGRTPILSTGLNLVRQFDNLIIDLRTRDEFVELKVSRPSNGNTTSSPSANWLSIDNYIDSLDAKRFQVDSFRELLLDQIGRSQKQSEAEAKIVVVLASSQFETNRLIADAAFGGQDPNLAARFLWITSHEWLQFHNTGEATNDEYDHKAEFHEQQLRLSPRYLLSTKIEAYPNINYNEFVYSLTPTSHSPIPSDWFDEFWQQNFNCKLAKRNETVQDKQQPKFNLKSFCNSNLRIDPTNELNRNFDKTHFTILTFEALRGALDRLKSKEALSNEESLLVSYFKDEFKGLNQARGSPWFGIEVYHKLVREESRRSLADNLRQNSRRIDVSPQDSIQLLKVGAMDEFRFWFIEKSLSNQNTSYEQNDPFDTSQVVLIESLNQLKRLIQTQCTLFLNNSFELSPSCKACKKQLDQARLLAEQERDKLNSELGLVEMDSSSPVAIKMLSIVDELRGLQYLPHFRVVDNETEYSIGSKKRVDDESSDEGLEASALSLFDNKNLKRQQDVIRLEDAEVLRRSLQSINHLRPKTVTGHYSLCESQPLALFVAVVSLIGVTIIIASITCIYPSMTRKSFIDLDNIDSPQSTLIDQFLMIGLLMLYSINISFLLPATTISVCLLRRIGLATSYTVTMSSILVKTLISHTHSHRLKNLSSLAVASSIHGSLSQNSMSCISASLNSLQLHCQYGTTANSSQNSDPLDVELTFESLPHEGQAMDARISQSEVSGQRQTGGNDHDESSQSQANQLKARFRGSLKYSRLVLAQTLLILMQLLVSLVWFLRQPAEPNFFVLCWHCVSPFKSRVLFLFEPLLSLIYPGVILIMGLLLSVAAYSRTVKARRISPKSCNNQIQTNLDSILSRAGKDQLIQMITMTVIFGLWLILTIDTVDTLQGYLASPASHPSSQNNYKENQHNIHHNYVDLYRAKANSDSKLILTNLVSATLIYLSFFVLRFGKFSKYGNLLKSGCSNWLCCICFHKSSSLEQATSQLASSKFKSSHLSLARNSALYASGSTTSMLNDNSTGCRLGTSIRRSTMPFSSLFTLSNKSKQDSTKIMSTSKRENCERLKLQHFNSYGTYNQAGDDKLDSDVNNTDNCYQEHNRTTINPLQMLAEGDDNRAATTAEIKQENFNCYRNCDEASVSNLSFRSDNSRTALSPSLQQSKGKNKKSSKGSKFLSSLTSSSGGKTAKGSVFNDKESPQPSSRPRKSPKPKVLRKKSSVHSEDSLSEAKCSNEENFGANNNDDTISCSSSQLEGKDLYPIDCSIQLDQFEASDQQRPANFCSNRKSWRRSSATSFSTGQKCDVIEEGQDYDEKVSAECDDEK